jgi:hypothetical protein
MDTTMTVVLERSLPRYDPEWHRRHDALLRLLGLERLRPVLPALGIPAPFVPPPSLLTAIFARVLEGGLSDRWEASYYSHDEMPAVVAAAFDEVGAAFGAAPAQALYEWGRALFPPQAMDRLDDSWWYVFLKLSQHLADSSLPSVPLPFDAAANASIQAAVQQWFNGPQDAADDALLSAVAAVPQSAFELRVLELERCECHPFPPGEGYSDIDGTVKLALWHRRTHQVLHALLAWMSNDQRTVFLAWAREQLNIRYAAGRADALVYPDAARTLALI